MKKQTLIITLISIFCFYQTKADSPLTSTYFAPSYYEYPLVQTAEIGHVLTSEIAAFLLDAKVPIDAKAAIINALGWNYDGQSNSETFKGFLAASKGITAAQINLDNLSGDELFCLGYLKALDDYFVVDDAINMLEKAAVKNKNSFTVHMILNLTKAQKAMDSDFCKVWKLTAEVINDKSLIRDMKTVAIQNIIDYTLLYKSECY